jgi:hypothetical protein
MNMCDAHCRNLFATVAKDQVTMPTARAPSFKHAAAEAV